MLFGYALVLLFCVAFAVLSCRFYFRSHQLPVHTFLPDLFSLQSIAIAFGGASALAFCDDGKYIWTLRGDHSVRVLVKDQLVRNSGIDERVAAYFADREVEIELPEKEVAEEPTQSDSSSA